jgi:hypothetical protein
MTRAFCITLLAILALWSFPGAAVDDGKDIYVRTDSHLYAFGK